MSKEEVAREDEPGQWKLMWSKVCVLIPVKVLAWLDGSAEKHRSYPLLYVMTGLIVSLAIASMWNFITRASIHHAGISAYLGGIALAGLVPVTVFFAVYANITPKQRKGVWAIAVTFVFLSAFIQFPVYVGERLTLSYLFSSRFDLEAFAFGAGNPIAECLLAVMEAMYLSSVAREDKRLLEEAAAETLKKEEANKKAERERKEQIRQDLDAQAKRLREEKEFEAAQARSQQEFALRLKLEETAALAKIELARAKVEAKMSKELSNDHGSVSNLDKGKVYNTPISQGRRLTKDESRDILLDTFRQNPELSYRDAGKTIGRSKDTVANYLKELQAKGKVVLNGHVEVR